MTRSWTIWLWLLDPNEQSFFLFGVNFCLTNVCVSASLIPGFEAVVTWEKGRYTTWHNSLKLCSAEPVHTYVAVAGERVVHFNEAQTAIFIFLWPKLASESNPPVFFPQSPS